MRSSAASSCGPHSHLRDPNASPVRHSECTRTSGAAPVMSPETIGDVIGAGRAVPVCHEAHVTVAGGDEGVGAQAHGAKQAEARRRDGIRALQVRREVLDRDDAARRRGRPISSRPGRRIISPSSCTISPITPTGCEPGEAHQVDGRFGVPGALAHAAGLRPQRQDVTGADHAARGRGGIRQDVQRAGAVARADSGRHADGGIDRHGVCRSAHIFVARDHRRQIEAIGPLRRASARTGSPTCTAPSTRPAPVWRARPRGSGRPRSRGPHRRRR